MGKKLLIIGAGGLAPEIEELARLLGYDTFGYLDDAPEKARYSSVLGKISEMAAFRKDFPEAAVALGNNEARLRFCNELIACGYTLPVLIHPTAFVSPDAALGEGSILRTRCVVSRFVTLGKACLINVGALIDHDCVLGDGVHAAMGCVIRGAQTVPPLTHVRANTVIED